MTCFLPSRAEVLENWHWRNPLPQGNSLHNVVFGNGAYVAVGDFGTILTSSNGTNWQRRLSGVTDTLRDCVYGGGQYIVVGDFGTILTSTDLATWASQYAGTFHGLNGVTYGNGQFVAVGEHTGIYTSSDGTLWTQRASGDWDVLDVSYAQGTFVAVGGSSATVSTTALGFILSSTDGRSWTRRLFGAEGPITAVAYGGGTFAAVLGSEPYTGLIGWISTNGTQWQAYANPTGDHYSLASVAYGGDKWVAGGPYWPDTSLYRGSGEIYAFDDLSTWVEVATNATAVSGLAFANGQFVASSQGGTFLLSANGMTWANPLTEPVEFGFQDVKYLNGSFVGVSGNHVAFSVNGTVWTNNITVTNTEPAADLWSIAFGNGRYVGGGEYETLWTSLDGVNWTNPLPDLNLGHMSVAFGNGLFVALGGSGDVLTSPDGLNWTAPQSVASSYAWDTDLTFGDRRFVAVAQNFAGSSSDGANWTIVPVERSLHAVTWGKGMYIAVGDRTVAVSTNGLDWTYLFSGEFENFTDIAFGAGFFVAVAAPFYNEVFVESPIWISSDGIHWSRRSSGTSRPLSTIAFGNGTFVIGGGAILQSDPLVSLEFVAQPVPQLLLWGPVNRSYRVEFVDNVSTPNSWSTLTTVVAKECPVSISEILGSRRFYRAVLLP
jgi:hypothetical protein